MLATCLAALLIAPPFPGRETASPVAATTVAYTLTVDSARTGFSVEMRIHGAPDTLRLGMAAHPEYDERFWRYVRDVRVHSGRGDVPVVRTDSAEWKAMAGGGDAVVRYRVEPPAVEEGFGSWVVHLGRGGGLVGGPGSFMYVVDRPAAPVRLSLRLPAGWTTGTGLTRTGPGQFTARDFAELMDSPVLVGPLRTWRFVVAGVPHDVAYLPAAEPAAVDTAALVRTFAGLAREARAVFGAFPYRRFTFLVQEGASAGLEHGTSVDLGIPSTPGAARSADFVIDVAHEYFHTWNEMHLRPRGWGGLSLHPSPPTRETWWMEGVTMLYAEMLARRAGLAVDDTRRERMESEIARYLDNPSNVLVSPEQSSKWNGDGPGAHGDLTPDVYLQGKLAGVLLDLMIRRETGGRRSLDDAMRLLYKRRGGAAGYTGADVQDAVASACGCAVANFFTRYVRGAGTLPFAEHLKPAGMDVAIAEVPALDAQGRPAADARVWTYVPAGESLPRLRVMHPRSAWTAAGLRTGDRLLRWNGTPIETPSDFRRRVRALRVGDSVRVEYERDGHPATAAFVVPGYTVHQVRLVAIPAATAAQRRIARQMLLQRTTATRGRRSDRRDSSGQARKRGEPPRLAPCRSSQPARRYASRRRSASARASQASIAHFTRLGSLATPARARRSPSSLSRAASASPCTIRLKRSPRASISANERPTMRSLIMDAAAWEMAQPWPLKRTSATRPSRKATCSRMSSPQVGFFMGTTTSGDSSSPRCVVLR
jgi:predicted metalloprotease with PDZ domain